MHQDARKLHAGNDAIGMLRNRLVAGFNAVYVKGEEDHRDFGSWEFNEDDEIDEDGNSNGIVWILQLESYDININCMIW